MEKVLNQKSDTHGLSPDSYISFLSDIRPINFTSQFFNLQKSSSITPTYDSELMKNYFLYKHLSI